MKNPNQHFSATPVSHRFVNERMSSWVSVRLLVMGTSCTYLFYHPLTKHPISLAHLYWKQKCSRLD